jgi:hypothetical protein
MTAVTAYEAKASFTFEDRENEPVEFPAGSLNRARWSKVLTGDIEGSSIVHLLLSQREGGPAVYVGIEHYDVAVQGRRGTFLLMHSATMLGEDHETAWTIVPGSGTADLAGIAGAAEITPEHDFILRYTLPS